MAFRVVFCFFSCLISFLFLIPNPSFVFEKGFKGGRCRGYGFDFRGLIERRWDGGR